MSIIQSTVSYYLSYSPEGSKTRTKVLTMGQQEPTSRSNNKLDKDPFWIKPVPNDRAV